MADVGRTTDRAQLMVVGALALAVALVALGVILNFAIYTENLATRDTNTDARNAITDRSIMQGTVERAVRYVNVEKAGSVNEAKLRTEHLWVNRSFSRYRAPTGASFQTDVASSREGTRLAQNESRTFNDTADTTDWTLATGVPIADTVRVHLNVSRGSLAEPAASAPASDLSTDAFHVNLTDSNDDDWQVYVYGDATEDLAYLTVVGPGESLTGSVAGITDVCATNRTEIHVDLVDGTFGETSCPFLEFFPGGLATSYSVGYNNTDRVQGTYDVLFGSRASVNSGNFASPGSGQPFEHVALVSATVDLTVKTADVTVKTQVTAGPELEPNGFSGYAPIVDQFVVTDNSNASSDTAEYEVNWTVRDRDQDLKRVRIVLVDNDTGERMSTTFTTGDPELGVDSGSGTTNLTDSGETVDSGDVYVVRLAVVDERDNTAIASEEDTV